MKYLFWRGSSLWCRFPFPGKPERYPLGIKRRSESKTEINRCIAEGEKIVAALRTKAIENRFFEIQKTEAPEDPTFCVLALEYWFYKLRFKKSGMNERYHLAHAVKRFGPYPISSITEKSVSLWLADMEKAGASINAINNRITYFKAALNHARKDYSRKMSFDFRILDQISKLEGGNVRQFVLTEERFERNYSFLLKRWPLFAPYYLALWETGRRPEEVARYTWEMVDADRQEIRVPAAIIKKKKAQTLPLSDRLFFDIVGKTPGHDRYGYLFKNSAGRPWENFEHIAQSLKEAFGESAGWIRDTRRGFVTHKTEVVQADESTVMELTGHVTNSVFQRYRVKDRKNLFAVLNGAKGTDSAQLQKNT